MLSVPKVEAVDRFNLIISIQSSFVCHDSVIRTDMPRPAWIIHFRNGTGIFLLLKPCDTLHKEPSSGWGTGRPSAISELCNLISPIKLHAGAFELPHGRLPSSYDWATYALCSWKRLGWGCDQKEHICPMTHALPFGSDFVPLQSHLWSDREYPLSLTNTGWVWRDLELAQDPF